MSEAGGHVYDDSHNNTSVRLDEYFRDALREGLDFQLERSRGYLPAGLVEEIRALSMPPILWNVELAEWFDIRFPPLELYRTYAVVKYFPADGPILIITDGLIESKLHVHREHAYLLPKGGRLPFKAKGKVFYFQ